MHTCLAITTTRTQTFLHSHLHQKIPPPTPPQVYCFSFIHWKEKNVCTTINHSHASFLLSFVSISLTVLICLHETYQSVQPGHNRSYSPIKLFLIGKYLDHLFTTQEDLYPHYWHPITYLTLLCFLYHFHSIKGHLVAKLGHQREAGRVLFIYAIWAQIRHIINSSLKW